MLGCASAQAVRINGDFGAFGGAGAWCGLTRGNRDPVCQAGCAAGVAGEQARDVEFVAFGATPSREVFDDVCGTGG